MDARCLTLFSSTDSPIKTQAASVLLHEAGDDNVPATTTEEQEVGNEVTETKHNNKNVGENEKPQAHDNDKKKNGSIGEARENYKFDVSRRRKLQENRSI